MGLHGVHVDESHPVPALIQWYFEATDPALFQTAVGATPGGPPHVFNVLAWDDNYSPWRTGAIFTAALGGPLLEDPVRDDCRPSEREMRLNAIPRLLACAFQIITDAHERGSVGMYSQCRNLKAIQDISVTAGAIVASIYTGGANDRAVP